VGMEELEEAVDRVVAGLERKSRVLSDKERVIVATHEMGHAMVALRSDNADPVHRVSIIPRGAAALGMTMQRPLEDRYLLTEPELKDRLAILLGGRTAEELVFSRISTGAQNDLQVATDIAKAMVVEFGMSPKVGPLSFGQNGFRGPDGRPLFPGERPDISEETARVVDGEVARLVNEAHERATEILTKDRPLLDRLAEVLIAREVMDGKELRSYVDGVVPIPTKEDLERELQEKAAENGQRDTKEIHPGPAIRPSAPPSESELPSPSIPSRPD
jgi:cell division protease FtsH